MSRAHRIVAAVLLSVPGAAYGQRTQESRFVSAMRLTNIADIELGRLDEQQAADPR